MMNSFLGKLSIALPANLAVFWLVFHGGSEDIFLLGSLAAAAGALLLTALERSHDSEQEPKRVPAVAPRRPGYLKNLSRHIRHA